MGRLEGRKYFIPVPCIALVLLNMTPSLTGRAVRHISLLIYCRSTSHLMTWNNDYYHKIEEQFDSATASKVAESYRAAIDFIKKVCLLFSGIGHHACSAVAALHV